ncbi:MAG TPA: RagB/SusD family nutrient uptake outer membrane protein, partial [Chryseosolibacter sp.]|nr:RagB/SusD family nutrient uptake outer membrane protein [Chryseosolibacter sp.]
FKNEYFMLDMFLNGDAQSDDAYAGADNPDIFQIDDYEIVATNANVGRDWGYLYSMIGKANRVINNVELVPDPALTDARKQQIKGEASFIRAYANFDLVRLYGDVPLVTQEVRSISAENLEQVYPLLFPERVSAEAVYDQIIADLEFALQTVRTTAPDKGYATVGAVNALLAKVYATREPHDWAKVKEYCDAVIAGGYSLLPEYDQLWDNAHENSSESIFEINCYNWDTGGNWGVFMFYGDDWKKFNIPSNDLVQAFEEEGDDIRMNASIAFLDVTGKWTDPHWPASHYPFVNKYRDFSGAQNFIIYRLADILLLKAEALNELGDTEGAAELVNEVRARVDLEPITAGSQADMRIAIAKERRLELAFEGHRWFDLKRTGRAIEVMNSATDGNGNSLGYQLTEEKLVWPIPQSERDKNTKLTQNPGY